LKRKIIIAGETGDHSIEKSYHRAAISLGHDAYLFDTRKAVLNYARPPVIGKELHRFFPVTAWLRKSNKDFVDFVRQTDPDIVILFTGAEILPGTLAYIRTISRSRIIWYWADPLPNLSSYIREGAVFTDLVASYSRSSFDMFRKMGASTVSWVPFAADMEVHGSNEPRKIIYDISFTGSWRPEREKVLTFIHKAFPSLRLRVDGPYWERCSYSPIKRLAGKKPQYGHDFTTIARSSLLSLNVTDTTNYPSANMRFFEIMASGGTELVSDSDELKESFLDMEHVLYFQDEKSLYDKISFALSNKDQVISIAEKGRDLVRQQHLYVHRLKGLLNI